MSKHFLETEGPQMTSQCGTYPLRAELARLNVCACTRPRARVPPRTHEPACARRPICNTYCFSTATAVSWTRLIVTLYVHCLSCPLCAYGLNAHHLWGGGGGGGGEKRMLLILLGGLQWMQHRNRVQSGHSWKTEQHERNLTELIPAEVQLVHISRFRSYLIKTHCAHITNTSR